MLRHIAFLMIGLMLLSNCTPPKPDEPMPDREFNKMVNHSVAKTIVETCKGFELTVDERQLAQLMMVDLLAKGYSVEEVTSMAYHIDTKRSEGAANQRLAQLEKKYGSDFCKAAARIDRRDWAVGQYFNRKS